MRRELQEVFLDISQVSDFENDFFLLARDPACYLGGEKFLALQVQCDNTVSCNSLFRVSNFPAIFNRSPNMNEKSSSRHFSIRDTWKLI